MTETKQAKWQTIRTVLTGAPDAITAAEKTWAGLPVGSRVWKLPQKTNQIELIATMPAEAQTATYNLWLYRDGGDAEFVCSGVMTAGTQVASNGQKYVDTITVAASRWVTTPTSTDTAGNNEQAKLIIDAMGRAVGFIEITAVTASVTLLGSYE